MKLYKHTLILILPLLVLCAGCNDSPSGSEPVAETAPAVEAVEAVPEAKASPEEQEARARFAKFWSTRFLECGKYSYTRMTRKWDLFLKTKTSPTAYLAVKGDPISWDLEIGELDPADQANGVTWCGHQIIQSPVSSYFDGRQWRPFRNGMAGFWEAGEIPGVDYTSLELLAVLQLCKYEDEEWSIGPSEEYPEVVWRKYLQIMFMEGAKQPLNCEEIPNR